MYKGQDPSSQCVRYSGGSTVHTAVTFLLVVYTSTNKRKVLGVNIIIALHKWTGYTVGCLANNIHAQYFVTYTT